MGLFDRLFGRKRTTGNVNGANLYNELFRGRPRPSVDEILERARSLSPQQSGIAKQAAAIELLRGRNVSKARELIIEALKEAGISLPSRIQLEADARKENLSKTQRQAITLAIVSRLVLDGEFEEARAILNRTNL